MADTDTPQPEQLTLERIYNGTSLSGPVPQGVKYSPDGKRVTFLRDGDEDGRYDLWQFDVETGEPSMLVSSKLLEPEEVELSEEEKALRERKRIAGRRGIVSYDWGTADTILVPLGGNLHLVTLGGTDEHLSIEIDPERASAFGLTEDKIRAEFEGAKTGLGGSEVPAEDLENLVLAVVDEQAVRLSDVAELHRKDGEPSVRQLTDTDAFEYDAKVSPGGRYVSFIRDEAVWAIDLESGEEQRLTPEADPENAIRYGVAEFVAQEEMSRYTGYWWSPDDRYLAYTRVDESTVDIIPRFDIAAEDVTVIEQRYPRAGRPNAIVDLFVLDMETGETVEVEWRREDWGPATDQYLARVNWGVHLGPKLIVQKTDRDQKTLEYTMHTISDLVPPDAVPGLHVFEAQPIFGELQSNWINLNSDLTRSGEWWFSTHEANGFRHVIALDGEEQQLTSGEWPVDELLRIQLSPSEIRTEQNNWEYFFTGYVDTPLERHLYWQRKGEDPTRLTELGKSWSITMAPDGKSFVGTSSSPTQPPQTGLYRIGQPLSDEQIEEMGAERLPDTDCIDTTPAHKQVTRECPPPSTLITWIEENALDETHPYTPYLQDHTVPEYGTLKAEDGSDLYYSIQTPPDFDPSKKYPVILYVYGGPGAQVVTRNWESLTDQYYTRQGYIVWRLDNRGTPNRGKAFEDVIYRQMGIPEVRDQLVGVEHLKSLPFVDADRIAIHGWSYGGYMTLMTILQAPEHTFAAAFAGAPVTDWALYDTFYTERYMDTPEDNPEGYEKSSVFYHLENLAHELPPLMLVHGMADDNVTFDNTTRLMAELQNKGILFELMTYPGERHGIRSPGMSHHLAETRANFFDRHLKPKD